MPELPEVETIRRQLAPAIARRRITRGGGHPSAKFSAAGDASGATITDVRRRGKYLLIDLDDQRQLVVHLGMTGRLDIRPLDDRPRRLHVRAWWELGDRTLELHDVRRFGRVAVVPTGDYRSLPTLAALGPEPLEPEFTPTGLWHAVRSSSVRVKTQLLSQRPVAGVGNIYADEALWRARINPAARTITHPAAGRLHAAIIDVLRAGVEHGGTTLRDYRTLDGSSGSNQFHLDCYGRSGEPCVRCGEMLARRTIDGRSTTWCRRCQPR
jgi:formamidopyrimidine-DNA glycosylase